MKKYYSYFSPDEPELVQGLKDFVVEVNKFLVGLVDDKHYHKSRTHGQSETRHVTYENGTWSFKGKRHRKDAPFTDEATISFRRQQAWRMTRKSELTGIGVLFEEEVKHCLLEVAKNYDADKPWCGPSWFNDEQNGLVYKAGYSGTEESFEIEETICDKDNNPLWKATCEGGYV